MNRLTRIRDVRDERFYTTGSPFFEGGVRHLTRFNDVEEAFRHERYGRLTADLSFLRAFLTNLRVPVPEKVHINVLFPWMQGDMKIDGSSGRHGVLHKILAKYFTKSSLNHLQTDVREYARALLRQEIVDGRDLFDLAAFAQKLSFRSISTLVGLPVAAEDFMREHIEAYAQRSGVEMMDPEPPELREFFRELFNAERAQPRGGLLTDLLGAEAVGTISRDERDALVWGCWAAGSGSTAAGISLLIGLLVDSGLMAEAEAKLTDERWLEDVINETLRYGTPFVLVPLISAEEVVMESGVTIPQGERVQLVLSAANRDPLVFGEDANEFRPGRSAAAKHFAFARGMHYCLGASLAGLEMRTALQEIALHLPDLHLENWERKPALLDHVLKAELGYDLRQAQRQLR